MAFGWKWLIPISLVWIVAVATIRAITLDGGIDRQHLLVGDRRARRRSSLGRCSSARRRTRTAEDEEPTAEFDAFAGGYPVPPMPGQCPTAVRPAVRRDPLDRCREEQ